MLPTKEISKAIQRRFEVHETGDLPELLSLYTEDATYWDTKGSVKGRVELGRYFGEFFKRFHTRFAILEEHRLDGQDAAIVLWECAVRRRMPDGSLSAELVMQRGMNLCGVRDGHISRDESYMDLASLEKLFAPVTA
jgi:ketosteroid isomerase-like protein